MRFIIIFCSIIAIAMWISKKSGVNLSEDQYFSLLASILILSFFITSMTTTKTIAKKFIKDFGAWIIIFMVVLLGYSFRFETTVVLNRLKANLTPSEAIIIGDKEAIIHKSLDGSFMVNAEINGQNIRFMVDTGASNVALSPSDATKIGININSLVYNQTINTANGINRAASITLPYIKIGDIEVQNVRASIVQQGLDGSLLGMSFLSRLAGFESKNDTMIFRGN